MNITMISTIFLPSHHFADLIFQQISRAGSGVYAIVTEAEVIISNVLAIIAVVVLTVSVLGLQDLPHQSWTLSGGPRPDRHCQPITVSLSLLLSLSLSARHRHWQSVIVTVKFGP